MTFLRTLSLTGWLTVAVIVLLLLTAGSCILFARQDAAERQKTTEAHKTLAEGRTAAAGDASAIRDSNDAANQSTRDQVKEDQDALRRETDPVARDASARRRLCVLNPGACPA